MQGDVPERLPASPRGARGHKVILCSGWPRTRQRAVHCGSKIQKGADIYHADVDLRLIYSDAEGGNYSRGEVQASEGC